MRLLFAALLVHVVAAQLIPHTWEVLRDIYDSLGGPNWVYPQSILPWRFGNASGPYKSTEYCRVLGGISCAGPYVQVLALDRFNLSGVLPDSVCFFANLTRFSMQGNNLSGNIPPCIFHLTGVEVFALQFNALSGEIPPFPNTSTATEVYLSWNQLSGSIPTMPAGVFVVDISHNLINGTLDDMFPEGGLTQMSLLNVGNNQLVGGLPAAFLKSPLLVMVNLNDNFLSDPLPDFPEHLWDPSAPPFQYLKELSLRNNSIPGNLPNWTLSSPMLVMLDVSHNRFTSPDLLKKVAEIFSYEAFLFVSRLDFSFNYFPTITYDDVWKNIVGLTYNDFQMINLIGLNSTPAGSGLLGTYFVATEVLQPETNNTFSCVMIANTRALSAFLALPSNFWAYDNCYCTNFFWGRPPNCFECPDEVKCARDTLTSPAAMYPVFDEGFQTFLGLLPCPHCLITSTVFGKHHQEPACEEGYEGRLCSECECEGEHNCFFKKDDECILCVPRQTWVYGLVGALLAAGMLAFVFFKKGSGALLILEGIIALVLMLLGVGASYLVDLVLFFVLLQIVEAASSRGAASSSEHGKREKKKLVSLTGMAKHLIFFIQATVLLTKESGDFFPTQLQSAIAAINVLNFRSTGMDCWSEFIVLSQKVGGASIARFVVSMSLPVVLVVFMTVSLTLRKVYTVLRDLVLVKCCGRKQEDLLPKTPSSVPDSEEYAKLLNSREITEVHHDGNDLEHPHDDHEHDKHFVPSFFAELVSMILFVFFATYFELSDVILENLSCKSDPFTGLKYLTSEPGVPCFGPAYATLQLAAWCMFGVIILGVPVLLMAGVFWNRKKLHDHKVELVFGMLYENYRMEYYWWEIVWILKRLGIAFAIGFFGKTQWSAFLVSLVLVLASSLSFFSRPFKHDFENSIELGTTGVLLVTYTTSLLEQREASATWAVFLLSLGWLVFMLGLMLSDSAKQLWRRFRRWRLKRRLIQRE